MSRSASFTFVPCTWLKHRSHTQEAGILCCGRAPEVRVPRHYTLLCNNPNDLWGAWRSLSSLRMVSTALLTAPVQSSVPLLKCLNLKTRQHTADIRRQEIYCSSGYVECETIHRVPACSYCRSTVYQLSYGFLKCRRRSGGLLWV